MPLWVVVYDVVVGVGVVVVVAGTGVAVVATVVTDVTGPYDVDVEAKLVGVTVVDNADDTTVTAVPAALVAVLVTEVVTTTVAYCSQ